MAAVHDLHQHMDRNLARPAEPLLATSLIDSSALGICFDELDILAIPGHSSTDPEILKTSSTDLDEALETTIQSGRVVAFSSETSSPRDDLARTLLVDCLVRDSERLAAVIDTTGNFDVMGLYTRILERLGQEPEIIAKLGGQVETDGMEQERERIAAGVLDRVRIMRVLDFVGIREAVEELRDGLEGRPMDSESEEEVRAPVEADRATATPLLQKRTEVADSEDEDETLEVSEDEMLFDTEPSGAGSATVQAPAIPPPEQQSRQHDQSTTPQPQSKLKFILIDNLAHVLTPLLEKDAAPANTMAIAFLTALSNLTRVYALHTILMNSCTVPRVVSPSRQPASNSTAQQQGVLVPQQSYTPQPPPPPSIFSSITAIPALMGLLGRFADAHVLLTMMPRGKLDARVYYADTGGRDRGKRRGVEMVTVVEVFADRWGGSVGAWGCLNMKGDGKGEGA
ncbi:hypothetical protein E8E13_007059 [Curvularia kusanoi]|uniref:DNA recombination and repair protein Rad51-like C-terminal domain-containing protein n=1 Tax=Curvularia kusanoi TaxID=90978 RepID=A0A9P4WD94_CURKU|nr:hypothetical protein E8E13_007059 [Curvularia kusanoi]